ncbi:MerR family DNA-binding transcriptional regulator [Catenulispora yoronensis]
MVGTAGRFDAVSTVSTASTISTVAAVDTETPLDIGEVAARSGLAPSALRFYEQRGLIESTGRNGLRRTYSPPCWTGSR